MAHLFLSAETMPEVKLRKDYSTEGIDTESTSRAFREVLTLFLQNTALVSLWTDVSGMATKAATDMFNPRATASSGSRRSRPIGNETCVTTRFLKHRDGKSWLCGNANWAKRNCQTLSNKFGDSSSWTERIGLMGKQTERNVGKSGRLKWRNARDWKTIFCRASTTNHYRTVLIFRIE